MQNLKKITLGAATVLAALAPVDGMVAGGQDASASTQETRLLLAIDERPALQADGSVVLTGTVRCPAGESFLLTANLAQGSEFHGNFIGGTCTGEVQPWSANVAVAGADYRRGDALARAILQPSNDTFDQVETANTVRVR
ncbi:DUF6299 family protein [Kribbella deserti]|uniref:DUF6299 family protein n=1 Tax=Kribbella deserti TaxID=1926257 RepID=A0ABV6QSG9_9ACTN